MLSARPSDFTPPLIAGWQPSPYTEGSCYLLTYALLLIITHYYSLLLINPTLVCLLAQRTLIPPTRLFYLVFFSNLFMFR